MLVKEIEKKEKPGKVMMLKDNLNNILDVFEMHFNTKYSWKRSKRWKDD